MKILKLSAFIFSAFSIVSCSSDNEMSITAPIEGKWYFKEYQVKGQTYPYSGHEACGKDYLQFGVNGANGIGKEVDVLGCTEFPNDFQYVLNGNTLTITDQGQTASGGVVELSEVTLRIKTVYDFDEDGAVDNVITVFTKE